MLHTEKPKKTVWGNFRIVNNELVYRAQTQVEFWMRDGKANQGHESALKDILSGKLKVTDGGQDLDTIKKRLESGMQCKITYNDYTTNVIAKKLPNGVVLGNSSILPLVGRTVSYGNERMNRSETQIQRRMVQRGMLMVPFSVFAEAKLDLNAFQMIEKGIEETVTRRVDNPRYNTWNADKNQIPKFIEEKVHFTGASLFSVDGATFLFDIDRREVKHKIFNAFLVQLPRKVKSIGEAYESLKPKDVVAAESKGLKVLRQGEWFFVPTKTPKLKAVKLTQSEIRELVFNRFRSDRSKSLAAKIDSMAKPLTLKAGPNRPNTVDMGIIVKGQAICTGKVNHSGREHAELKLDGWYKAIPNTSTKSFTITGDVD
jgi:hypothetical protein